MSSLATGHSPGAFRDPPQRSRPVRRFCLHLGGYSVRTGRRSADRLRVRGARDCSSAGPSRNYSARRFTILSYRDERTIARSLLASVRRCERTEEAVLSLIGPNGQPVRMAFSGYRLPELGGHVFIGLRGKRAAVRTRRLPGRGKRPAQVQGVRRERRANISSAPAVDKEQRLSLIRLLGFEELQQQPASEPERDLLAQHRRVACARTPCDGDLATRVGPDRFGLLHGTETDIGQLQEATSEPRRRRRSAIEANSPSSAPASRSIAKPFGPRRSPRASSTSSIASALPTTVHPSCAGSRRARSQSWPKRR